MLQMRKVFYAFAIVLIALIITPNAIMRVSACADCDHITLSDRLAHIAPSLAEIDFDVLLADIDQYEDFFIVIRMQEIYGQVDVLSVNVVSEEQLGLLFIYADEDLNLLLSIPLASINAGCCNNPIIFVFRIEFFCSVRATRVIYRLIFCAGCNFEDLIPLYR